MGNVNTSLGQSASRGVLSFPRFCFRYYFVFYFAIKFTSIYMKFYGSFNFFCIKLHHLLKVPPLASAARLVVWEMGLELALALALETDGIERKMAAEFNTIRRDVKKRIIKCNFTSGEINYFGMYFCQTYHGSEFPAATPTMLMGSNGVEVAERCSGPKRMSGIILSLQTLFFLHFHNFILKKFLFLFTFQPAKHTEMNINSFYNHCPLGNFG